MTFSLFIFITATCFVVMSFNVITMQPIKLWKFEEETCKQRSLKPIHFQRSNQHPFQSMNYCLICTIS